MAARMQTSNLKYKLYSKTTLPSILKQYLLYSSHSSSISKPHQLIAMLPVNIPTVLLAALPFLASAMPTSPANLDNILLPRASQCLDDVATAHVCSVRQMTPKVSYNSKAADMLISQTSDAVNCINQLAAKGSTPCKAGLHTTFCIHGSCLLFGASGPANDGSKPGYVAESTW
jgi:hypothetical protein